ncbi:TRAP transporter large permease [Deltaproteobacteria bacterium]|nr:TRAP transporter large permease [Deltaproteobacteria bacterium]
MDPLILGIAGFATLFFLIFVFRMPIGFAMAIIGFIGIWLISSISAALGSLATIPYRTVAFSSMSVIPMFILMGEFAFHSGIISDSYKTVNKWIGHLPGGLGMATIGGCSAFAACCGSSVACCTVMVPVAWPEMQKYKYAPSLALGTIAAGGTLGVLIPPSTGFVIYGILAEQSIGRLLIAGLLPGILLSVAFMLAIYLSVRIKPSLVGVPTAKANWHERIASLKGVWLVIILGAVVLGSIWFGLCTPEEAGGLGALTTLIIALGRKRLTKIQFVQSLVNTARTSAMVFTILIGAMIFNSFLVITGLPNILSEFVSGLPLPPTAILITILVFYFLLGSVMDPLAMTILTLPVILPTLGQLEINLIWFGVLFTIMTELAMITPPIGINVFVISGMAKDVNMYSVFRGVLPFVLAMVACLAILISFPQISLLLPMAMR